MAALQSIAISDVRQTPYYVKTLALAIVAVSIGVQLSTWVFFAPMIRDGHADFRNLYAAGYMVRTGHGNALYDYAAEKLFQDSVVSREQVAIPFVRPAYQALLFAVLSFTSFRSAYFAFLALNLALLAFSYRMLRPKMQPLADIYPWLPAAMFLAFVPVGAALMQGQDSIILLALLAGAVVALDRGWEYTSGDISWARTFQTAAGNTDCGVVFYLAPVAVLGGLRVHWRSAGRRLGLDCWCGAGNRLCPLHAGNECFANTRFRTVVTRYRDGQSSRPDCGNNSHSRRLCGDTYTLDIHVYLGRDKRQKSRRHRVGNHRERVHQLLSLSSRLDSSAYSHRANAEPICRTGVARRKGCCISVCGAGTQRISAVQFLGARVASLRFFILPDAGHSLPAEPSCNAKLRDVPQFICPICDGVPGRTRSVAPPVYNQSRGFIRCTRTVLHGRCIRSTPYIATIS